MPELNEIEVSWFGGEPLLGKAVIEDISLHIRTLANSHAVRYQANITTNGYFLDRITAQQLVALGINFFQVSLDGPQPTHDATRVRADGRGTFSRIWENLVALHESRLVVTIMLRLHVSPSNLSELPTLVDKINDAFAGDDRFKVFFKAVERLGNPNDHLMPVFPHNKKQEVLESLRTRLIESGQRYQLTPPDTTYICYASKPNSLVIRANGDIAKCTVAFNDDRNRVGKLLPNGRIEVDQEKVRWWARGFGSMLDKELTCPYGAAPRTVMLDSPRL